MSRQKARCRMQIVIDIDERRFKDILRISTIQLKGRTPTLEQVIAKGIPLPKGHGRLIDADELEVISGTINDWRTEDFVLLDEIEVAPTIIEADKAGEEE